MNKISLDELIGNLQTYELRRSSQLKEGTKRDRSLALKGLEEDGSHFDEEEMAMITRKFKKFFRNPKRTPKRRTSVSLEAMNGSSSLAVSSVVSMTTL